MILNKKLLKTTLAGIVLASSAIATNAHAVQLLGWQLDTTSLGGALQTGINNLSFNGESFIDTSATSLSLPGSAFTFTDTGVFNLTQYNGGPGLALNGGELTAVFNATGTGNLGGAFTFNAGGILDFYFDSSANYGATSTENYGAGAGPGSTLIASFTQLAGGGGTVNPDGTPTSNGQITLSYVSTLLNPSVWKDLGGNSLPITLTLGFVTSNASQDNGANNNPGTIDPNLVTALGGVLPNNAPDTFFVNNGGQVKLETVPEPTTLALLGLGLLGAGYKKRLSTKA